MKKSILIPALIISILTSTLLYFLYTTQKEKLIADTFTTLNLSLAYNKKQILTFIEKELEITQADARAQKTPSAQYLLINAQGKIVAHSYKNGGIFKNSPEENLFNTVLLTKKPAASSTLFDPFLAKPTLICAAPQLAGDDVSHVLIRHIPLSLLFTQLDYSLLNNTGDIVIAKQTPFGTVFMNNTRFAPHEHSKTLIYNQSAYASTQGHTIPSDQMPLIHETLVGKPASKHTTDYRLNPVLAASDILPELGWALVVQQDIKKALAPLFALFLLLIFSWALSIALILYALGRTIIYPQELVLLTICTTLLGCSACYLWYKRHILITQPLEQLIAQETTTITQLTHELQNSLRTLEVQTEQLLQELHTTHTLSTAHIQLQLSLFLENLPMASSCVLITPTTLNTATKQNNAVIFTELPQQKRTLLQKLPATSTGSWFDTVENPFTTTPTAVYALTKDSLTLYCFYNPAYLANRLKQEKTIDDLHTVFFSSHLIPFYDSTTSNVTTLTSEQKKLQDALATVTEPHGMLMHDDGLIFYTSNTQLKWIIASSLSSSRIPLPLQQINSLTLWLIALISLTCACGICLIGLVQKWSFTRISTIVSLLLLGAISTSWYLISTTITTIPSEQFSVTTAAEVKQIEEILFDDATRKQITIAPALPTGIVLQDITVSPFQTMNIVGHIWQKYDLVAHQHITRGIRIAQTFKSNIIETYKTNDGTTETVGWDFSVEMAAPEADIRYPFDCKKFELKLEHPDKTKHILLIPDLAAYDTIAPEAKPGIGRTVNLPGFLLQKSFFNYQPTLVQASKSTQPLAPVLAYSALAQRLIMDALIMYLLPLFIIILALFLVEYLAERNREKNPELEFYFSVFNMYTALFFTLVLMHRSLRTEFPSGGEIIFIEYFFFSTYIILLGLLLLALVRPRGIKIATKYGSFSLVTHFYWPLQTLIALGVTLWMFS